MAGSEFGSRLRELRDAAGLSQQGLADKSGLNVFTIAKIEQGHRPDPVWSTVCVLADALDVEVVAFREPPSKVYVAPEGRPPAEKPAPPAPAKKRKGNK